jgi:3-dehydroquinate synthetase
MVQILSNQQIKNELIGCLKKYHLPTSDPVSFDELKPYINRDKKGRKDLLKIVDVTEIGTSVIVRSQYKL